MKNILLGILVVGVSFLAYQILFASPLKGEWKSNKRLTIKEWEKDNVSYSKREFVEKMLGQMTFVISKDSWSYSFDGQEGTEAYKVISSKDGCHTVELVAEGITTMKNVCVDGENMYISLPEFSSNEVFTKISK